MLVPINLLTSVTAVVVLTKSLVNFTIDGAVGAVAFKVSNFAVEVVEGLIAVPLFVDETPTPFLDLTPILTMLVETGAK